jgi:hypothetical protein
MRRKNLKDWLEDILTSSLYILGFCAALIGLCLGTVTAFVIFLNIFEVMI